MAETIKRTEIEKEIRERIMNIIAPVLEQELGADILAVKTNEFSIPLLDKYGNEIFANIKISVPRGVRAGHGYVPYDGYAAAEDYTLEQEEKKAKREASNAKKAAAAAKREHDRELRKTVRTMKQDVKELVAQ